MDWVRKIPYTGLEIDVQRVAKQLRHEEALRRTSDSPKKTLRTMNKIFACGGPSKFPCDLHEECASGSAMAWLCKL